MVAGIKKSTEIVVAEILEKYPDYDCSKVRYVNAKTPIEIICPRHKPFKKSPTDGYECQACSIERRTKAQTSSAEEFVQRALLVHGTKYNYSLVEYCTARIRVKIICNTHGHVFEQTPYRHLAGNGCKLCANDKQAAHRQADKEHFVKRSVAQHGEGVFTYENVVYKNAKTQVTVTCKEHGDFPTYPDNHWLGAGCPDCSEAGFSSNRAGILYVMHCDRDNMTKVGITNDQLIKRNKAINKSYGKDFTILKHYENSSGLLISNVETSLILHLRKLYKQPSFKFDGYTECFYDVDHTLLLNTIEKKIGEYSDEKEEEEFCPVWAVKREAEACTC